MHITQPVALAHVDVDWYEPVMTCLERVFPQLVVGGSIILDRFSCLSLEPLLVLSLDLFPAKH